MWYVVTFLFFVVGKSQGLLVSEKTCIPYFSSEKTHKPVYKSFGLDNLLVSLPDSKRGDTSCTVYNCTLYTYAYILHMHTVSNQSLMGTGTDLNGLKHLITYKRYLSLESLGKNPASFETVRTTYYTYSNMHSSQLRAKDNTIDAVLVTFK